MSKAPSKERAFLHVSRVKNPERTVAERIHDYREVDLAQPLPVLREQASRCMDCGIPYCHQGCPLGNLIPDWNNLIYAGRWAEAATALHATNNFPEVTGRVCPAPCEAACVLGLEDKPVTIKSIERSIADAIFDGEPPLPAVRASHSSGYSVAVVGSGPAGLAAAQQLARAGHRVTVYEQDDRLGGLLRYGIPDFKLEKAVLDKRLAQLRAEGVVFQTGAKIGVDIPTSAVRSEHDALVLCGGAMQARSPELPGTTLGGVHYAMEFLTQQNRRVAGDAITATEAITAAGRHVVVLGGGDTGSDCVGTAIRQGAASVTSLELMPAPPAQRQPHNPWPEWPYIYRSSSSHEEGGTRDFGIRTTALVGGSDGEKRISALEAVRVIRDGAGLRDVPGSTFRMACDLLLVATGFVGPVRHGMLADLGVALTARGNVATTHGHTSVPGVFAGGDMARGQSLVVWAIAEGRRVAEAVDRWLRDRTHRYQG